MRCIQAGLPLQGEAGRVCQEIQGVVHVPERRYPQWMGKTGRQAAFQGQSTGHSKSPGSRNRQDALRGKPQAQDSVLPPMHLAPRGHWPDTGTMALMLTPHQTCCPGLQTCVVNSENPQPYATTTQTEPCWPAPLRPSPQTGRCPSGAAWAADTHFTVISATFLS